MKKMLLSGLLATLVLCFCMPCSSVAQTNDSKSCQAANIEYKDNYGGDDEAGVVYNNVFTRFVPAKDGAQGFWFYVYQKGKIWLCEGAQEENYTDFPEYVTVRVYEGEQGEVLSAKYTTHGVGYVITDHGAFTPFYFYDGGQAHAVLNYLRPDTIVVSATVSAPFKAEALPMFRVDSSLRQLNCGEEKPEFMEMLNSVTIL